MGRQPTGVPLEHSRTRDTTAARWLSSAKDSTLFSGTILWYLMRAQWYPSPGGRGGSELCLVVGLGPG
jgi:hypothetical protein